MENILKDLKTIILETVNISNKKENEKEYKNTEEKLKPYKEDLKKEEVKENIKPDNRTELQKKYIEQESRLDNLDLNYDTEPSDEFKKRTKESVAGKENEEGNEVNKEIWDKSTEKNQTREDINQEAGAMRTFGNVAFKVDGKPASKKTVTAESKKRLVSKKPFENEQKALKLIPEAFKVNGYNFELTDGNITYDIIWESTFGKGYPNILSVSNKEEKSKLLESMQSLINYKPAKNKTARKEFFKDEDTFFRNTFEDFKFEE